MYFYNKGKKIFSSLATLYTFRVPSLAARKVLRMKSSKRHSKLVYINHRGDPEKAADRTHLRKKRKEKRTYTMDLCYSREIPLFLYIEASKMINEH